MPNSLHRSFRDQPSRFCWKKAERSLRGVQPWPYSSRAGEEGNTLGTQHSRAHPKGHLPLSTQSCSASTHPSIHPALSHCSVEGREE